jgi:hypothetical protein
MTMGYWIVDGRKLTNEEYEELKRQERLEKMRAQEEAQRLSRRLGEAYAALKEHLRRNPGTRQHVPDDRALDQEIYQTLCRNLERANEAPRCGAIKEDGTLCRSPRLNDDIHCYAHYRMREARAMKLELAAVADPNGIQMSIMQVQRALIDGTISEKTAGLLLYSLQIAAANVDKTTFGQAKDEDMVTETMEEEERIREQREWMEKERRVEAIQTLPRMNTDQETDREIGRSGDRVIGISGEAGPVGHTGMVGQTEGYANRGPSAEVYANLG